VSFLNGAGAETGWIGFGASANANAHFMNNRAGGNTALGAGGVERLTVTPSGSIGIGTTSPQARLDVRGDVKLGNSGQYFAPGGEENLRIVRGILDRDGNIIAGSGFQVSHTLTGVYIITFDTPFAGPPAVTATPGVNDDVIDILTYGVTTSTISFGLYVDSFGHISHSGAFHFIVIGPR
jgi:hypothetical protein